MKLAKRHNAPIIVAKLDRLARNIHFISGLMVHRVRSCHRVGCRCGPVMLHIYAAGGKGTPVDKSEN